MTRKDFELIAETLAYCEAHCDNADELTIVRWVAGHFGEALKSTNPRFDEGRFLVAALPIGYSAKVAVVAEP